MAKKLLKNIKEYHNKVLTNEFFINFSKKKVLLNVTLTFILPLVIFSIPIINNNHWSIGAWWGNFYSKLSSGVLFSSSISILATLTSTYVDKLSILKEVKKEGNHELLIKKIERLNVAIPIISLTFLLTYICAYYFGQLTGNNRLNPTGTIIQFILYVVVQIIFGITDGQINESHINSDNVKKFEEQFNQDIEKTSLDIDQELEGIPENISRIEETHYLENLDEELNDIPTQSTYQ